MVVGDVSTLDVPPLSGNPFDSRPIERGRAHEIVGRDEILITWKEHMHSQSPRLLLLVGERGSGRTSLVNAISSQTDRHFIGYFWHREDPLNRALDEMAVTFCGHEVPNSMHQKVERIVETLDSLSGPLPLIAFDYPSEVEIIREILLNAILSKTGGNARLVISTLRDLIDEKRGLGSEGTLHGLIGWKSPNSEIFGELTDEEQEKPHKIESTQEFSRDINESIFSEIEKEVDLDEDSLEGEEPEDMWDGEESEEDFDDQSGNIIRDSTSSITKLEDSQDNVSEQEMEAEDFPTKITGWDEGESSGVYIEEDFTR